MNVAEVAAFSVVGRAVRDYCHALGIDDDDEQDAIYEKVIDLLADLTEEEE